MLTSRSHHVFLVQHMKQPGPRADGSLAAAAAEIQAMGEGGFRFPSGPQELADTSAPKAESEATSLHRAAQCVSSPRTDVGSFSRPLLQAIVVPW